MSLRPSSSACSADAPFPATGGCASSLFELTPAAATALWSSGAAEDGCSAFLGSWLFAVCGRGNTRLLMRFSLASIRVAAKKPPAAAVGGCSCCPGSEAAQRRYGALAATPDGTRCTTCNSLQMQQQHLGQRLDQELPVRG